MDHFRASHLPALYTIVPWELQQVHQSKRTRQHLHHTIHLQVPAQSTERVNDRIEEGSRISMKAQY